MKTGKNLLNLTTARLVKFMEWWILSKLITQLAQLLVAVILGLKIYLFTLYPQADKLPSNIKDTNVFEIGKYWCFQGV